MFKIGDRIKTKNNVRSTLSNYVWIVVKVQPERIGFINHMTLNSIDNKIETLACQDDGWMFDVDYYRKLKLKKICSKLEI